jgi:dolichol-phosphate mannosyltransferase
VSTPRTSTHRSSTDTERPTTSSGGGFSYEGVLVGVPTYNERENVTRLVTALRENLPGATILVVDDGSPDGTGDLAAEMARSDPLVHLLRRPRKMGLGTAYVAVFDHARSIGARIAMTMDADFSHRPQDAPAVVRAALRPGVDLAIGSRYVPGGDIVGWPQSRKLLSTIANRLIRASLRTSTHDCTASFRAYSMELIDRLDFSKLESTGYSALPELLLLIDGVGATIVEVPITFVERERGATKLTKRELAKSLANVVRMRRRRVARSRAQRRAGAAGKGAR